MAPLAIYPMFNSARQRHGSDACLGQRSRDNLLGFFADQIQVCSPFEWGPMTMSAAARAAELLVRVKNLLWRILVGGPRYPGRRAPRRRCLFRPLALRHSPSPAQQGRGAGAPDQGRIRGAGGLRRPPRAGAEPGADPDPHQPLKHMHFPMQFLHRPSEPQIDHDVIE